jgi:holliday junction DNA helicase RuvB
MLSSNESEFEWLFKALEEETVDELDIFSPPTFGDYIGQEQSKTFLKIMLDAAKKEHRPLPNILIVGGFGLGKTALAKLAFKEFGLKENLVDGNSVNTNLPSGNVIIDEIHNVSTNVCDSLNIKLDDGSVHLIGCTTNPGLLPSAFRSRFRVIQLNNYSVEELALIARKICNRKNVTASDTILKEIAKRARFNARYVITYLRTIFDVMAINNQTSITENTLNQVFTMLSVDKDGYLDRDRTYVRAMPSDRPVGIKWLSAVLGIDGVTIEEEIEPFLLQTGVIDRTPRGRVRIKAI